MSNETPELKLLAGGRTALEQELLEALFTPGADLHVQSLKARLTRRGRIEVVSTSTRHDAPSTDGA